MLLSFFLNYCHILTLFFSSMIQSHFSHVDITQVPHRLEELECSSICLHQLQTVNFHICAYYYQHAMSLIQFILANSTSLKTLSFEVGFNSQKLDAPVLLSISRDLLLMKRASQRAEVKFIHLDCIWFYLSTPPFWEVRMQEL
jgi:hypothetical protein